MSVGPLNALIPATCVELTWFDKDIESRAERGHGVSLRDGLHDTCVGRAVTYFPISLGSDEHAQAPVHLYVPSWSQSLHNYLGELIRFQPAAQPLFGIRLQWTSYSGSRSVIRYAESLGVRINLGKQVRSSWENEERKVSGVTTTSHGEVHEATLVVAADGVRREAHEFALVRLCVTMTKCTQTEPQGYTLKMSGYAVYRASWFDPTEKGESTRIDPLTSYLCTVGSERYSMDGSVSIYEGNKDVWLNLPQAKRWTC